MNYSLLRQNPFKVLLVISIIMLAVCYPVFHVKSSGANNVIYSVPMKEKIVALTYDDGPYPVYTEQIIQVLDKYQVKATFFMIGKQVQRYPEIAKMVMDRGHVIANHTYDHPHNLEACSPSQIKTELEDSERILTQLTGHRTLFFRPPCGFINSTVSLIAQEEGYRTILWTVSADHHDAPTPALMAERVLRLIKPGGIILMHDGKMQPRWKDVLATSIIIRTLLEKGYRFVTIPELVKQESAEYYSGG